MKKYRDRKAGLPIREMQQPVPWLPGKKAIIWLWNSSRARQTTIAQNITILLAAWYPITMRSSFFARYSFAPAYFENRA